MDTINRKLVEARLAVMKSIKEEVVKADDPLDVILRHQHQLDSLGNLVQDEINLLFARYSSIGCTFEEFRSDMIEMFSRCGFCYKDDIVKGYNLEEGMVVYELLVGIDHHEPYNVIQMRLQIIEGLS